MTTVVRWSCLALLLTCLATLCSAQVCNTPFETSPQRKEGQVLWSECESNQLRKFGYPIGAYAFPYTEQVLAPTYTGPYSMAGTKVDLIWIADNVTIPRTLFSNGGDVIIVANKVVLGAGIDTRFYFRHDFANSQRLPEWRYAFENPKYQNSMRDYYSNCLDCNPSEHLLPRLPSGLPGSPFTGPPPARIDLNGKDAPENEINYQTLRSGDIYIFARTVEIPASFAKPNVPEQERCPASARDFHPYLLNAGGLRGGLGGMGGTGGPVSRHPERPFDPADSAFDWVGGLSGRPGKGGDAGSIFVSLVNGSTEEARSLQQILGPNSTVAGGAGGERGQLRTPSTVGPNQVTDSVCVFPTVDQAPAQPSGLSGNFAVGTLTANDFLRQLEIILRQREALGKYDLDLFLKLSEVDSKVASISPLYPLTEFFYETLKSLNKGLLHRFAAQTAGDEEAASTPTPAILDGLSTKELQSVALESDQLVLLDAIRNFDGTLEGFFEKSGGLLNIRTTSPTNLIVAQAARVDASQGNNSLATIVANTRELNSTVLQSVLAQRQIEIEKRLADLRAALVRLQEKARQVGARSLLTQVTEIVDQIGKTVTAMQGGDVLHAANDFQATFVLLNKLFTGDNASTDAPSAIEAVKEELAALAIQRQGLITYMTEARKRDETLSSDARFDRLVAKASAKAKQQAKQLMFAELTKHALISYLLDPSRGVDGLWNNMRALDLYTDGVITNEPAFYLRDVDAFCRDASSCRLFEASASWRVVSGRFTLAGSDVVLPIYILAPTKKSLTLPLFGISQNSIQIKKVAAAPTTVPLSLHQWSLLQ